MTNRPDLIIQYKIKRTEAKGVLRSAKSEYIKEELRKHGDDPRRFWVELNKLIKTNQKNSKYSITDDNNSQIKDEGLPDHVNSFFSTIGLNLAKKFTDTQPADNSINTTIPALSFNEVTETQLLTKIKKIYI